MRRYWLVLAIMLSFGLVTGCGDDDATGTGTGTDSGTTTGTDGGGTTGTDGGGTTGTDGGDTDTDAGDPTGGNACTNETDAMTITDVDVSGEAGDCGIGCIGGAADCADTCLEAAVPALSAECRTCYVDVVNCGIANCIAACAADTGSEGCVACRCGENTAMVNCQADYTTCSGIPDDSCDA